MAIGFKRLFALTVLAAALCGLALPVRAQTAAGSKIAYSFAKGQKASYVSKTHQAITAGPTGEKVMDNNVDFTTEVLAVDAAGAAKIKLTVTRVVFTLKGGLVGTSYDSASKSAPSDPVSKMWSTLVNRPVQFQVAPEGVILNVGALDEPAAGGGKAAGAELDSAAIDQVIQIMPLSLCTLPSQPVAAGAAWQTERSFALPILNRKMTATSSYRLTEAKGEDVRIGMESFKAAVDPSDKGPGVGPGSNMKIEVAESSGKGTLVVRPALGLVQSAGLETAMKLTLVREGGAGVPIPVETLTRVDVTRVK